MIRSSSQTQNPSAPAKISSGLSTAGPLVALAVLIALGLADRTMAQGLSGPPKRLEETLGQRSGQEDSDESSYEEEMQMEMEMEMEMDAYGGEYDEDGGYGGSSRGRATGTPQSDAIQTYASSLSAVMGGLDLSPLFDSSQPITVESGPILHREAEQAFLAGNQALALELIFGHMATEYKEALDDLQSVKYSTALKRPVWNIRWGVSMASQGGDGLPDPKPIRQGATPIQQSFAGGGQEDYGADMEEQGMDDYEPEMEMEMQMEMEMEMEQGYDGSGRTPSRPTAPAMPVRKMLSDEANETLDRTLGLVATVLADEFKKRFQNGDFGSLFASVTEPLAVESSRRGSAIAAAPVQASMSEALNDALSEVAEPIEMWQPGIVYLGLGTDEEIIPKARAANLDLVFHFIAVLKPGRNEAVQNISRCRLIHVASGKSMGVSKGMDNMEAQRMAAKRGMAERTYVEEQYSTLLAIVDRDVKVVDLPTLSPDVARKRIASLMAGPHARTLRTLAEVRLYQLQGLIDESEVEAIFDIIGGVDALMLLHGPQEERMAMVRKWAVESQGPAVGQ